MWGISSRTKPKQPEPEVCEHDWEVVERGGYYRINFSFPNKELVEFGPICKGDIDPNIISAYMSIYGKIQIPENRVCLKCGECYGGIARFKKMYDEQERRAREESKAARRRKMWAKQLWEDGCKTKDEK
jgi:hypothetical protein